PASARVLELGCAAGNNIIPFAERHPGARALGLDLSSVQIAQGAARKVGEGGCSGASHGAATLGRAFQPLAVDFLTKLSVGAR
uniref:hypothetical protein n=1 Tax=Variovorax paradoxus TaxID=34073 RepID=UPI0038D222FF